MSSEIEAHLKAVMGLDAASIGSPAVARAVAERMEGTRLTREEDYLHHLRASSAEQQALIEAVVVPETWFFRDPEAFRALTTVAWPQWEKADGAERGGRFRVLSLPCSTGEEPYSVAMALLDAGVPADRFVVEAVDISERAVARARQGQYGRNSFRGEDLSFRERHFEPQNGRWSVRAGIAAQVRFGVGNLFDDGFLADRERFDVIFCRNVLIYFDRPTQDRALAVLRRLLRPDGHVFVGPSETNLMRDHDFTPVRFPLAFCFSAASAEAREPVRPVMRREPRGAVAPRPFKRIYPPSTAVPRRAVAPGPAPVAGPVRNALEQAARLADQGHLAEAAQQCEVHLQSHGPSAGAYYLLGLVRDAAGNSAEAIGFYRKAIYLEPRHHEALLHLAYLMEKQGDVAAAQVLNDRARRSAPAEQS